MWFKQITFYVLPKSPDFSPEELAERLQEHEFAPVTGLDWFSEGFAPPHGFSPELVFPAQHTWAVSLKKSEKVLPAAVVRDLLDDKIAQIQEAEARHVGRKEKQELKEVPFLKKDGVWFMPPPII